MLLPPRNGSLKMAQGRWERLVPLFHFRVIFVRADTKGRTYDESHYDDDIDNDANGDASARPPEACVLTRKTSELSPGAWLVDEPSKFHSRRSATDSGDLLRVMVLERRPLSPSIQMSGGLAVVQI